jgi:hypothetical protein
MATATTVEEDVIDVIEVGTSSWSLFLELKCIIQKRYAIARAKALAQVTE